MQSLGYIINLPYQSMPRNLYPSYIIYYGRYHLWTSNNELIDHTSRMYVLYTDIHSIVLEMNIRCEALVQKKKCQLVNDVWCSMISSRHVIFLSSFLFQTHIIIYVTLIKY